VGNHLLLHPKVEFGDIVPEGSTLEHCLFMKKDKLVHGTLFLNVVDSLLHNVACTEIAKDVWDNFCATFEKRHVDNKL
jgi:hypothetical protein